MVNKLANDGQIVFEVTADGKHAIANIRDITREIQKESSKWDTAAKQSTDNIGNNFTSILKKIAAGFSAVKIGQELLQIGKDALQAASDLQEVQNVVDVTFGENSNKIEAWAKQAGTQFGLTETQAKKFTSTLGAMLKSSGMTGEKIADVSTDLAGLAADMASFYNLDFDTAFQKIRSGLSGETEPLKQLGINMSVANLEAFALQQGLEKTFSEMDQGEQTMLRYQYIMQATSDAQGDFARTSDGYANSMRKLETNIESLKTKLGETLIPIVSDAVAAVNGFLESLTPTHTRTVLDDFADIDLKTEQKLEQIRTTAGEARLLTEELEKIGGAKSSTAGSKVQQLVNSLSNIDLNQGKAGAVKDFIATLGENIDVISSIQGSSADEAAKWLESISNAANNLDENDAQGWSTLLTSIKEGLPGLENTDFGANFFKSLGEGFTDVSEQSSVLQWVVDSLGDKTNKTAEEQALWLETCQRLVKTIPGLSSIINTETGEVKGGTQAVKDYIKAWEDGQTKLALLQAVEEKESALAARFSDMPGLELDMAVAERRVKNSFKQLKDLYKKYGVDMGFNEQGKIVRDFNTYGLQADEIKALNEETDYYERLVANANDARTAYETQKAALEEAKQALIEYRKTVDEMPGTIDEATKATAEWSEEAKENAQTIIEAVTDATQALSDYYDNIRANVAASVDSAINGFGKITTPMQQAQQQTKDLTKKLTDLGSRTEKNADEWDQLNDEINKYNSEKVTSQRMGKNLEEQAKYMEEYLANLRKARELGVSDAVLAQLSDGSAESYDYLAALAEASPGEVETINENYQKVIDKKKELTDELTAQQLTVDQTYQSLADKAKEAVAALDLEETAKENSGKTIAGMAQGIADHVPEVKDAVDAIIAQLERLDGFGIDIDAGGFGNIKIVTTTGKTEGSARMGLDWVPHDDYIARLHEGEKVLSAQEASLYRGLANGSLNGVDLDALGGVMRDNVKPGGNVYLDGRVVGSVISDRQGKAYKSLQRSGWQA